VAGSSGGIGPRSPNMLAGLRMLYKAIQATIEDGPCTRFVRCGLPERSRLIAYGGKLPLKKVKTEAENHG
jgi:hypothetical protein